MTDRPIVHLVAAARPNFMKVAPLYHALAPAGWCDVRLVHTGQHYDDDMSGAFIRDLGLPAPDHHLGVGSGSHAEQTAGVMIAYERVCLSERPAWVVVAGDVNSTIACALTAKKIGVQVAHLEAGLRSRDRTMPEEINRVLTDAISDLLWTPSADADENLRAEGIPPERIVRVGNIMIDCYEMMRARIEEAQAAASLGLQPRSYAVVTLHRPSNVDTPGVLGRLVETLKAVADRLPVVFPVHPRTRARLEEFGLLERLEAAPHIRLTRPSPYIGFMSLVTDARLVLTDSGGVQEETTYLGIPCLTLRDTTERPITVTQGTNELVSVTTVMDRVTAALARPVGQARRPEFWDGHTAQRVARSLEATLA